MGAGGDDKRKAGGEKRFEGCQDCSGWPEKNTPRASNSLCSVSLYLEAGLQTHTHMINYLHTSYSHSYIIEGRPTHDHTHDHMTK